MREALEVALASNIDEVTADTAEHGAVDEAPSEASVKAQRRAQTRKAVVAQRMTMSQRKWDRQKNLTLKDLSDIFHSIESIRDKMLEVDPNLECSVAICQGTGTILDLYFKLYDEKKKASTTQITLDKFFTSKYILILEVSIILSYSVVNIHVFSIIFK